MGPVLSFTGVLLATLLVLAFAIALIARYWVIRTEPVVLRGIDPERARHVVAVYIENVHDTRFGFPTGVFRIDERSSTPTRLVAREENFRGSVGLEFSRTALAVPAAFVAAAADGGCLMFFIALFAAVAVSALIIGPVVVVSVVEVILRWLMRGEVTAEVHEQQGEPDTCAVRFTLRGLSGFGVHRQLLRGLAAPVLPTAYGGSQLENAAEPWQRDRLNLVYAGGGVVAVVVALLVVALTPSLRGGGSDSTAYGSYDSYDAYDASSDGTADSSGGDGYDETYEDDPYDDGSGDAYDDGSGTQDGSGDGSGSDGSEEEAPLAPGLATTAADGGRYTIHPPDGWTRTASEQDEGSYVESRWAPDGEEDVSFLVDHTPGFKGTPREGAEGVRDYFLAVRSYRELDFSETEVAGEPAWRWEFTAKRLRKLDTFVVACGVGYAVLGTAPAPRWDEFSTLFEDATATLVPDCHEDAGADAEPEPDASGATADDGADDAGETPQDVLERHFERLGARDFDAAFALTTPRYQRSASNWPAARAASDPAISPLRFGAVTLGDDEASVDVTFFARDRRATANSDTKCRRFVGSAHLRLVDGTWRYDPPGNDYAATVVRASDPDCP